MFNDKMRELGSLPSIIRELSSEAELKKKELGKDKVFDFTIGNPSINPPKEVKDALIDLIQNEDSISLHSYTESIGLYETRLHIKEYLEKTYNASLDENLIYITQGASSGLAITLKALLNEGDEVISFVPYFPEYKIYTESASGVFHGVMCDENFKLDFNLLRKEMNPKVKVVIINSPNNPTGVIYTEDEIIKLSQLLKEFEDKYNHPIYLLSDEPYRLLIYEDFKYPFITNYYDDSIVTYSFSKSVSLPGERIGYIVLSPNAKDKSEVFEALDGAGRALGYICASSLFQKLLPRILGITSDLSLYKKNRDALMKGLKKLGYEFAYPSGAFYLYMKSPIEDAISFANTAKKFNIFVVPSDPFGMKGYVRIAYCVSYETIVNSMSSFKRLKEYYGDKNDWTR